jgi:hypothetical protein
MRLHPPRRTAVKLREVLRPSQRTRGRDCCRQSHSDFARQYFTPNFLVGLKGALNSLDQIPEPTRGKPFRDRSDELSGVHGRDAQDDAPNGALAVDDEMVQLGQEPRFKVRNTINLTMHVAGLETEMPDLDGL